MLKFINFFKVVEETDKVISVGSYEYSEFKVQVGRCTLRAIIPSKYTLEVNKIYKTKQMYLTGGYAEVEDVRYDKAIIRIESFFEPKPSENEEAVLSFTRRPVFKFVGRFCPPNECKIKQLPPSYDPAFIFTTILLNERAESFPVKCIAFGNRAVKVSAFKRNIKISVTTSYRESNNVGEYKVIAINILQASADSEYLEEDSDRAEAVVC